MIMDKDLMCAENCGVDILASKDTAILNDNRVLEHLLESEIIYMPPIELFKKSHLDPDTRKIVVKWMLEVCEEEGCAPPVLPLAINIFDRFMSKCNAPKNCLQLIAADCILIATKIRQNLPIPVNTLCYYTDHSVTACQLRKFETLIMSKLKWDLAAVTSFDFIDQILQRTERCRNSKHEKIIRTHSITLLNICCTDIEFYGCKPSMIATATVICAMKGIHLKMDDLQFVNICSLLKTNRRQVEQVCDKIERIVSQEISRLNTSQPKLESQSKENECPNTSVTEESSSSICGQMSDEYADSGTDAAVVSFAIKKLDTLKKPETPVEVQNVTL